MIYLQSIFLYDSETVDTRKIEKFLSEDCQDLIKTGKHKERRQIEIYLSERVDVAFFREGVPIYHVYPITKLIKEKASELATHFKQKTLFS